VVSLRKGTRNFSALHQHRNGAQRDVRSEPGQQLGDGDIEAGEIVTGGEAEKKVKIKKVKVSANWVMTHYSHPRMGSLSNHANSAPLW
jgi:hypothetical protein